jgi:hypothetical protein
MISFKSSKSRRSSDKMQSSTSKSMPWYTCSHMALGELSQTSEPLIESRC